jgi:hypothetical protein
VLAGSLIAKPRVDPASALPSRVLLTWAGDPATTQAVTWRTESPTPDARAEIVRASSDPKALDNAPSSRATSQIVSVDGRSVTYHSVRFTGLQSDTLYAYRVGDGVRWSEWNHFRTASREHKPFSFIYVGDAQNDVLSLWSRAIRSAYQEASKASFILHAGDLINRANMDYEWAEWFDAAGWINRTVPSVAVPGNHEYASGRISQFWRPQFEFPLNGVPGLEESCYYLDYQGLRIIGLDSNRMHKEQAAWLDKVLADNQSRWTIVTFHHPVHSLAGNRDNKDVRDNWEPILEKHGVDLVLQGHDHTYGRMRNLPTGNNVKRGAAPVYVVSVSGPKMYAINPKNLPMMRRAAENSQLYQVVHVDRSKISYKAFTVTGQLHDAFELHKDANGVKRLVDQAPPGLR